MRKWLDSMRFASPLVGGSLPRTCCGATAFCFLRRVRGVKLSKIILFFLAALMLLPGCLSSRKGLLTSAEGMDRQALLRTWGKPTRVTVLPGGNVRYEYLGTVPASPAPESRSTVTVAGSKTIGVAVPANDMHRPALQCVTVFDLSPASRVIAVHQQGAGCPLVSS